VAAAHAAAERIAGPHQHVGQGIEIALAGSDQHRLGAMIAGLI
jgi:hypothetical protein